MNPIRLTKQEASNLVNKYKKQINEKNYDEIFKDLQKTTGPQSSHIPTSVAKYLEFFILAGVNPLLYMSEIPTLLFSRCFLETITIPGNIKFISDLAFTKSRFTEVIIEDGVEGLGGGVFESCESLAKITFPKTIDPIFEDVLLNCYSLTSVYINNGESIPSIIKAIKASGSNTPVTAYINKDVVTQRIIKKYSLENPINGYFELKVTSNRE